MPIVRKLLCVIFLFCTVACADELIFTPLTEFMRLLPAGTGAPGQYLKSDGTWGQPTASAAWGSITGTLSAQTDLGGALDGKVGTSDSRLSDARTPTTHSHPPSEVTGTAVITTDGRLSDARTPTTHTHAYLTDTGSTAATSATTGTMTVNMTTDIITITPTGACTFNASGGATGQIVTFSITTSGTTSYTLTFGTNFRKVGTLATGTASARFFAVTFRNINGTIWQEIARTAVQT